MDILVLASSLALLSYVIGIIVYALPVPYRPIKKLGMTLIIDAIAAMILITIYNVFIYLGNFILNLLNLTWSDFYNWLVGRTAALVSVFAGISYLMSMMKLSQYSFLTSPLNLVLTYISLALSALKVVYFLSTLIFKFRKELLLLGVLLYSLPFRIGKGVGAFLIACSLILFVGFPLMPAFVHYFEGSIVSSGSFGLTTIKGKITDALGNPLPYSIILIYLNNMKLNGIPSAVITSDSRGLFILGNGKDIIPKNTTLYFGIEYLGYRFIPQPAKMTVSNVLYHVTLQVKPLIYSSGVALLIPFNYVVLKKVISSNLIDLTILPIGLLSTTVKLTLIKYSDSYVYKLVINNKSYSCVWSNTTWKGIKLNICYINIRLQRPNKEINIVIFHSPSQPKKPNVSTKRLLLFNNIASLIASYISLGVSLLYSLVFLPGVYVSFLLSMSAALSRILGGGVKVKLI